ncbi:hypothetical protein QIS99_12490 [Streptomyces sp. B-S-A8]|uniref:Uncharacterized protein n=1 Tax=Streptomyces solicavernae TaxID=3043614 RepID=A0ABT6RRJ5_9ACTN|nr:hypothetical protein [Streptomyces sp. B-S-A8]MDI3387010.1 hypothetical protein [Streptomyces sp. B-S-A8]
MAKTPPRTSGRTGRLLLVVATLTALAAVPAAAAVQTEPEPAPAPAQQAKERSAPVQAKEPSAAAAPSHSGGPKNVAERVAHFYAAYVDVAYSANDLADDSAATELRKFYLTSELRSRLAKWEQQNEADGVLMAQNVPSAWKVTPGDSGMGHTWSTVRLTWGSGQDRTYTYIAVQSDLATRKISDIKSKY